jgi:hypothetical protein
MHIPTMPTSPLTLMLQHAWPAVQEEQQAAEPSPRSSWNSAASSNDTPESTPLCKPSPEHLSLPASTTTVNTTAAGPSRTPPKDMQGSSPVHINPAAATAESPKQQLEEDNGSTDVFSRLYHKPIQCQQQMVRRQRLPSAQIMQ